MFFLFPSPTSIKSYTEFLFIQRTIQSFNLLSFMSLISPVFIMIYSYVWWFPLWFEVSLVLTLSTLPLPLPPFCLPRINTFVKYCRKWITGGVKCVRSNSSQTLAGIWNTWMALWNAGRGALLLEFPIQYGWGGTREFALLTGSQVKLKLLVLESPI